jgi:hypothetical protein
MTLYLDTDTIAGKDGGNSLEEILIIEAQPKRRKKVTKISTW